MCALAMFCLALAPLPASATVQIGDQVTLYDGVGWPGGIFIVDNLTSTAADFDTFCAEIEETIFFNPAVYVVSNISTTTSLTGMNLGPMAAWAYTGYLNGSILPGPDRTVVSKVNALQAVIWRGMGYPHASVLIPGMDLALYAQLQADYAISGWTGLGNIRVMTLLSLTGQHSQDQLVPIGPGSGLPEPMSFVMWSLIATCIGAVSLYKSRCRSR
jgi:hypothetical protein